MRACEICREVHPVHGCQCRRPAGHDTHHQAAQGRDDILWTNDDGTLRTIRRQTPTPEEAAQAMDALRAGQRAREADDEPAEKAAVVALGLPLAIGIILLRPYAMLQVAAWYGYGPGPTARAVLVLMAVLLIWGAGRAKKDVPRGYQVLRNLLSAYLWIGVAVGLAWLFRAWEAM